MIKSILSDGWGKAFKAKVNKNGSLNVVIHPYPADDIELVQLPYRQYFTDDGSPTGSTDMAVNGSTTSQDFYVSAVEDYDIYVKYISAEISDNGSPALNKFGSLSALTNGVEWSWFTQSDGDYILHEGIKSNIEFIRISSDTGAIGTGVDAYLADVSGGGTAKSYLPNLDITEVFGIPYGLKLRKGTTDKIVFRVRDNLSSLVKFDIIAHGFRI